MSNARGEAFALVHFTLHKAATYLFHAFILRMPSQPGSGRAKPEMIHLPSHFNHFSAGCFFFFFCERKFLERRYCATVFSPSVFFFPSCSKRALINTFIPTLLFCATCGKSPPPDRRATNQTLQQAKKKYTPGHLGHPN